MGLFGGSKHKAPMVTKPINEFKVGDRIAIIFKAAAPYSTPKEIYVWDTEKLVTVKNLSNKITFISVPEKEGVYASSSWDLQINGDTNESVECSSYIDNKCFPLEPDEAIDAILAKKCLIIYVYDLNSMDYFTELFNKKGHKLYTYDEIK